MGNTRHTYITKILIRELFTQPTSIKPEPEETVV